MLPSLTVAFLLGLLSGSQISYFPLTITCVSTAVAFGLHVLEQTRRLDARRMWVLYGSFLAGILYWSATVQNVSFQSFPSANHDSLPATVTGRIVEPVQHGPNRSIFIVETDEGDSRPKRIRLIWHDPRQALYCGDRIQVHGTFRPPIGTRNPGGFDYASYMERQGIDLLGTITNGSAITVLGNEPQSLTWSLWNHVDRWRGTISARAMNSLSQPALGMFLGMIIGERGYLGQELQEWFMVTGTIHLLSISGSHLGLVALVILWSVKQAILRLPSIWLLNLSRTITPTRVAILCTWPVVVLYALLAGAEVATVRSLVMMTLALMALWLGYERHLQHALAAALLMIVVHDPRAIFDISFQLSFLSMFVMIQMILHVTSQGEEVTVPYLGVGHRLADYGRNAVFMSMAITVGTFPIVAFYFNQVPWLGGVTNLIAVPLTGFVLVPLGLLSAVWAIVSGTDGLVFGFALERLFDGLAQGLRWCAHIPGAEWHIPAPSIPTLFVFYAGLLVGVIEVMSRRFKMASAGLMALMICWWIVSPQLGGDGDHWRVTFLDVGQGDSAVIELPTGQTVLIDGGTRHERVDMGRSVVAPFLWNRGISHIDHVVGTHPQLDHVGGFIWVLRHLSIGQYWGTSLERPESFMGDLKTVVRHQRIQERHAARGEEMVGEGPCSLKVLNPPQEFEEPRVVKNFSGSFLNNQSIVLRLQCGVHSILFAADIEVDGLRQLDGEGRQPVTILKVPHHGARSSLDGEWVRHVRPSIAVISVGAHNPYGHPVPSVLQAYAEQQTVLYRTDLDGAVWITGQLSTSEFTVTRMRDLMLQPVDLPRCHWQCEHDNWRRLILQLS